MSDDHDTAVTLCLIPQKLEFRMVDMIRSTLSPHNLPTLVYFGLATVMGWWVHEHRGRGHSHEDFGKTAHWILSVCLGVILVNWFLMHVFRKAIYLPCFRGALGLRTARRNRDEDSPRWYLSFLREYRHPMRYNLELTHFVFLGGTLALWIHLEQEDSPTSPKAYQRITDNLRTIDSCGLWWVVVAPSAMWAWSTFWSRFARGQMSSMTRQYQTNIRRDLGSVGDGESVSLWAVTSFSIKALTALLSTLILDPTRDFIWDRDPDRHDNNAQIAVVSVVLGVVILLNLVFWVTYRAAHLLSVERVTGKSANESTDNRVEGTLDMLFTHLDFPGTLALLLLCTWQFAARVDEDTTEITGMAVSAMFAFHMTYAIGGTIGVLSIPPELRPRDTGVVPLGSRAGAAWAHPSSERFSIDDDDGLSSKAASRKSRMKPAMIESGVPNSNNL